MISIQTYVHRGQSVLRRWLLEPKVHAVVHAAGYVLSGLCMSAASLTGKLLPLALAAVCGSSGWMSILTALGAGVGYLLFWGEEGQQALVWVAAGTCLSVGLGLRQINRQMPLLLPALAGLIVAVCGVIFQAAAQDVTAFIVYLIRVGMAFFATWLFSLVLQRRNPVLDWVACGVAVFALAQILPVPYLGLGFLAAGVLTVGAPFPVAAIAGLALDLAQVTPVPMTAVTTLAYLVRFLPHPPAWMRGGMPGFVYMVILWIGGFWDFQPLVGLLLGGYLGIFLPAMGNVTHHRGETGVAQVRLEVAAGVLSQIQQLLIEVPQIPVDEDALVSRAAALACGSCPYRKNCKDSRRLGQLSGLILRKPLHRPEELPIVCRKSGRFLNELHRSQEQLRAIQADRERQAEYRTATVQQYRFVSEFLQDLSDQLAKRSVSSVQIYTPHVEVYGNRPEADNGDKCLRFAGTGGRYYVLLCDGMGTGSGAIQESRLAGNLLRRMLTAGFPAAYALRSLNSLCVLRDRAAAVTVDMAEIYLDTGKTTIYKWGAAPSYLISRGGAERVGTVTPPPGLSVTDQKESAQRITLRRNQLLVLVSDGVDTEDALRCCMEEQAEPPGEVAARILACACRSGGDDATVVLVYLTQTES